MSGSRFVVKASCFAVMAGAGLLSGAAIGVLLGIIGSLLFETAALLPIVVVPAVGGAIDVTGHRFPLGRNYETRYGPADAQKLWPLARNAAVLSTGFSTRVGFASLYALAISIVLTASPMIGLFVWGAYGLARSASVGLVMWLLRSRTPLEVLSYRPQVVRAVGGIAIMLSAVVLVVAASGSSPPEDVLSPHDSVPSEVDESAFPEACRSRGSRELVERFVTGYNDGVTGTSMTDEFFAPSDRFELFYDGDFRAGDDITDRDSLGAYFAQRLADGDRLLMVEFSFNGYRVEDDTGHFGIVFSRNGEKLVSKGAIDCGSARIMFWSMGRPEQE